MKNVRKIVACDLDGTLLKGNSLHLYFEGVLRYGTVLERAYTLWWLFLRCTKLIAHRIMKFNIMRHVKPNQRLKNWFTERANESLNTEVEKLLSEYKEAGCEILLATAAADTYIPWIWQGDFVATCILDNPEMKECRGEEKLNAVIEFLGTDGRLEAVITDHEDDLPLLKAGAKRNHIVDRKTGKVTPWNKKSL